MARLLAVSTSGYYKRAKRSVTTALTDGQPRKADLTVKIIADLRAAGEQISEKTVAARARSRCAPPSSIPPPRSRPI
jgi:putative transposase